MSDKPEPNLFLLRDVVRDVINELEKPGPNSKDALAFLEGYDVEELSKNSPFRMPLQVAASELRTGSLAEALNMFHDIQHDVRKELPRFRIVLFDETGFWTDPAIVAAAGKLWGAYLYDENRRVHVAELTASHELTYLYTSTENQVDDDIDEIIRLNGDGGEPVTYVHCSRIDAMSWDHKRPCGAPADTQAENYDALVESEREYYVANVSFETPGTPILKDLLGVVVDLAEAGEMRKAKSIFDAEVCKLAVAPYINRALEIFKKMSFTDAVDGIAKFKANPLVQDYGSEFIGFRQVQSHKMAAEAITSVTNYGMNFGEDEGSKFSAREVASDSDWPWIVGQYVSDDRFPTSFNIKGQSPLVELLSDRAKKSLLSLGVDIKDTASVARMGAYATDHHTLFYQYVWQVQPMAALDWKASMAEAKEAVVAAKPSSPDTSPAP